MIVKLILLFSFLSFKNVQLSDIFFNFLKHRMLWHFSIKQKKLHHLILPLRFFFPYLLIQTKYPTFKTELFSSAAVKD